jgi:hypothetical protein
MGLDSFLDFSLEGIGVEGCGCLHRRIAAIVIAASTALPLGACFQSAADVAYCDKLSASDRSVAASTAAPNDAVPVAMSVCATKPANSIPVLEKALAENKISPPSRN